MKRMRRTPFRSRLSSVSGTAATTNDDRCESDSRTPRSSQQHSPKAKERPDAVIVQPNLPRSAVHGFVEEGRLMSYPPSEAEVYRKAAAMVDRILKGAKFSHLPVEQPTKFEPRINMKPRRRAASQCRHRSSPALMWSSNE